jgi:pimeloyl-ACP methyl ester carboxylesterase
VPTLTANGIDVYYERWGSGPRLLFLNGSGTDLDSTRFLVELFAEGFEVVVHDQRGLGRTSIPAGPYRMADYAADAAALLDHVGWASARVVGVSFGGMVAQELAVTWPRRIERLALVCTSPGGAAGASYPLHELESLPTDQAAALGVRLLDTRFTDEWLAEHPDDRAIAEMMAARAGVERSDDAVRGQRLQLEARRGHDVGDRLGAIACPTLVAGGRFDGIAPLPNGEAIAARVPGAQLRVYEGGHAFFAQDPTALPEIRGFLADDTD